MYDTDDALFPLDVLLGYVSHLSPPHVRCQANLLEVRATWQRELESVRAEVAHKRALAAQQVRSREEDEQIKVRRGVRAAARPSRRRGGAHGNDDRP